MATISEYTIHGHPAFVYSLSQHLHKSLTIRRENRTSPSDLRTLYRHSADEGLPPELDQLTSPHNGIPTTPILPPTPPAINGENSDHAPEESSSDATAFRSTLVTPINQNSPPTPDNTPPRERKLSFARPFLGTQISLASTRAESFKTAREDFGSEDESPLISPETEGHTPRVSTYHSRVTNGVHAHPQSALARSALNEEDELVPAQTNGSRGSTHDPAQLPEQSETDDHQQEATIQPVEDKPKQSLQPSAIDEVDQSKLEEIPIALQVDESPEQKVDPAPAPASVRKGSSLRDRLEQAERFTPSASTEKFASIIGWTNSVDPRLDQNKRDSGISTTSTIGAIVVDPSPLPRRHTTLRKIAKNDSLRSASSPLPNSNRTSQNSSNDSPHRLVHKKVRLSNENRLSFGSEPSRSYSMYSSAVQPKLEVIKVAVIPERTSSLQSSAASSRRHSVSSTSHKTQVSKGSKHLPPSSWQRKRTISESQDRGREEQQAFVVPSRRSSLSAPTSRTTSRANSITSENFHIQRRMAEKDLRKTLDRMESDRLLSSLQTVHKQHANGEPTSVGAKSTPGQPSAWESSARIPSKVPKQELPQVNIQTEPTRPRQQPTQVTPGTSEWAALRPTSVLDTPFSQPSYQSASPEINEATAVNFFPHNNHSLQIIEPNTTLESRAVREVRRDEYLKDETQSPLRNPRQPPEPPKFNVIPPSPGDEMDKQLGSSRLGSVRRRPSQPRSRSFMKTLSRGLSLKNATNRKASQDLDGSLHPFWRPRPFWDDEAHGVKPADGEQERALERTGRVNNSLGFPQSDTVITGPVSLVRRISEHRRQNRALVKQSSQTSLARLRASRKLYKSPFLGLNLRLIGIHELQERMLFARQRKEDERRETRRAALRESIGANVISQGDSRFPVSSSSLMKV